MISQRNRLAIPIRIFGRRLIELYDAILSGQNAELTVRSTLQRAAGYIQYNTNPAAGIPQKFYAFQPVSTGTIQPIIDTTTGVFYVPPGSTTHTSLATKTQAKQSSFFAVGNYLHIGNPEFSLKWDGGAPQGVTNWGIAIGSINNAVGPNACGAGANVTKLPGHDVAWTNPGNITVQDGAFATCNLLAANISDYLQATTFGFAIPVTNTISGILVEVKGLQTNSGQTTFHAQLLKGGNLIGNDRITPSLPTANGFISIGGANDLWGTTWTPSDINQTNFGVSLFANQAAADNYSIDFVRITIFGTGGPTVVVNAGAGTFSATQGYQYLFAFGNSNDGNISNPTPASISTGVFTNKLRTEISLTASTDPQVNQIRVFRTTDTGTGAVFFELPNSPFPNTTATVFDTAADGALQVAQAIIVGTLNFSPPPAGLANIEWYAGRLWGSVGNLLYYSAGPDNAPMGKGTSNWPPGNVFELPTQIVKNCALNGGNGMLVITIDGVHVVQGISNPGFTVNRWLSDVGARQQNAVDTDGSNIYVFTSDRQFLRISAQGIEELSQGISDQTDLLDPALVYVTQHRSGSQDSRVFLTDGSATIYPYNLMMGAWELPKIPADGGGVGALGSIEIQPGVWKLLKGSSTIGQLVLQRDQNTFTDNGISYSWNAVFGNIPLTDPTQLANVESLVLRMTNASVSLPAVSILPNDISGAFIPIGPPRDEPPEGSTPPAGHQAKKYYLNTGGQLWTQMTHLQIQFSFGAFATQDEILSWGLFPNQATDQAVGAIPQVQGR